MKVPLVDLKRRYESLKPEIDAAIHNVIDTTAFINGPDVKLFEKEFASYCNTKHGIGCGNGTVALHLALQATGVGKGDEVITVPNTFIATTEAISYLGSKVKFVDITPDTMLMDVSQVEKLITPQTKAIVPVHLYGQMVDMKHLKEIADKHNLIIIEDSAQCHGAEQDQKKVPYCDIATFSLFPAKIMGAFGDAGIVVTNNDEIAEKVKLLCNHGRIDKYEHLIEGYNYRLDTIHAATLRVMLKHLDNWVNRRRERAYLYNKLLEEADVQTPFEAQNNKHAYYMYVIKSKRRDELMSFLNTKEVYTGIHYPIPLHLQPAYNHLNFPLGSFPVTEQCSKEILSLPFFPELTDEEIMHVVDSIKSFTQL